MVSGAPLTILELDVLEPEAFVAAVAPLFEGAPAFLARLAAARPFGSWDRLFEGARTIARSMPEAEQRELLDAHPRLGAPPAQVSALSFREQGYDRAVSAGPVAGDRGHALVRALDHDLERRNDAYERRFGFRYCVFVDGRTREELLPGFDAALAAEPDAERQRGLEAVIDIAESRQRTLAGHG